MIPLLLFEKKSETIRRLTVREVANEVGVSIGSCHSILTDELGMKRVSAKLVPKLLTEDQMEHRIEELKIEYSPDLAPCDFFFVPKTKNYPQKARDSRMLM